MNNMSMDLTTHPTQMEFRQINNCFLREILFFSKRGLDSTRVYLGDDVIVARREASRNEMMIHAMTLYGEGFFEELFEANLDPKPREIEDIIETKEEQNA